MNKYYKIRVGIEEYPVDEKDISRILQAMQTNEIVRLDCGMFRGQAILAVIRDTNKEFQEALSSLPGPEPTIEEILNNQRLACSRCDKKGYLFEEKLNEKTKITEKFVKICICQKMSAPNKVDTSALVKKMSI